jgi:hypothetical protein
MTCVPDADVETGWLTASCSLTIPEERAEVIAIAKVCVFVVL